MKIDQFFGQFNPAEEEASQSFDPLPPGTYPVVVVEAELKETIAKTGHYIKIVLKIPDDHEYGGRMFFDNINIDNPNAQCVEIGRKQLAALGQAAGLIAITDTDHLLGATVLAKVKVKPASGGYDASNEIKTYLPYNNSVAGNSNGFAQQNTQPPQQQAEQPQQQKPQNPWAK